ncbi:putative mitochondrial protein [Vitis vinifera]|uniref:Putative mitochondrial protein n=1 Tax=Vitis vinifera TaxID=29760 RepID=A0A438H290_VITVI|nr:putative mitochondrial protein [Vitis vinifera]
MANSHRRRNCLSKIKIDGVWLTEEQEIKGGVVGAFKDLLTDPGGWHPSMEGLDFNRIGDEEAARLDEVFSEDEVFLALSDLNGDKAPSPDGFPLSFSQFCWDFIKEEASRTLETSEPISLVGGLYKLLAKVLANRLKKVVDKVVSSAQNAFVEGRQILDAVLIANEAIDSLLKRNESGQRFQSWFDGTPKGYFNSSRGLRQGDPLSPYLFVIGMEALSRLIHRAVGGGFLSGCRVNGRGRDGALVSHLLFADDTLVFCEASEDQMVYLNWLLMWFEAISGLRINLDKSEILSVGRVENLETLALEAGCKVGRLPSSYLGIPLGVNHKSVAVWDGVEERFRKRKFGEEEGGWVTREVRESYGVGFWKEIRKEGGLGRRVLGFFGRGRVWSPRFSRPFNDWEVEEMERFLLTIWGVRLIPLVEDRMLWKVTSNGIFSAKSLYNDLSSRRAGLFPHGLI